MPFRLVAAFRSALHAFFVIGLTSVVRVTDEMGFDLPVPLTLEVDNQTAINFSKDSTKLSKMKHIDMRQSWVEALRDLGTT